MPEPGRERFSRAQVVAFRVAGHALDVRLEAGDLAGAAGRCGLQDSPPGSALLSLAARVEGVGPDTLTQAVEDRSVVRTWAMRGAPYVVPTADLAAFTAGALPVTEEARRRMLLGVGETLDRLGTDLDRVVALTDGHLDEVLAGRRLDVGALGEALAPLVGSHLMQSQRAVWEAEGPYAAGQPAGEGVVHFCLRVLTLHRRLCFAPREGSSYPFVLLDEWLRTGSEGLPREADVDGSASRAELLRRHLRCHGPTTRADLAHLLGVRVGDVAPWWDLLVDRAHHRALWRPVGDPGAVLVDGEVVGAWRARRQGSHLALTVTPFGPLSAAGRAGIEDEAHAVAALRGAADLDLAVE